MEEAVLSVAQATLQVSRIKTDTADQIEQLRKTQKEALQPHEREIAELTETISLWASQNKADFGNRRSLAVRGHTIGWRVGNPTATLVRPDGAPRKQTWAGFVEAALGKGKRFRDRYLRTKHEPDREAITSTNNEIELAELRDLGVEVRQDDAFYIDLSLDK